MSALATPKAPSRIACRDHRTHRVQLGRRRRALRHVLRILPDAAGAEERTEVDQCRVTLHGAQPLAEPVRPDERAEQCRVRRVAGFEIVGEHRGRYLPRRFALAHDRRRDTLRDHADDPAVAVEQLLFGVRLDVNGAWRDDEAPRVDASRGLRACEHAGRRNAGYSPAAQADVAVEPGVAGAVDDLSAGDDGLVRVGVRGRGVQARERRTHARTP